MDPDLSKSRSPEIIRLTKEQAEAHIRQFEQTLAELFRSVSPEDFVPEASHRLRRAAADMSQFAYYPPHSMVHAIEACCAYGNHAESFLLPEDHFRRIINTLTTFDDPALTATITPDSDLFEFIVYMHRTQMDKQGGMWWMPIGRMVRLFGDPQGVPVCEADFARRFGLTLRQWLQLSFAVEAATIGEKTKFSRSYASYFPELGMSSIVVDRFLDEVSRTPEQIGTGYRQIRTTWNPRTWFQHKPQIARTPLIALPRGYVAPVEAYVVDLFGDSLFRRLVTEDSDAVRREVGRRYERYVEDVIRHHLPAARIWTSADLVVEGGKSSDFAIDLPDCVLLVECKAVIFERDVVTRNAVLQSSAVDKIVDGYEQVIRTAERISLGAYANLGLEVAKPRYGIVATLGVVPGANHAAVWLHAQSVLQKRGVTSVPAPGLLASSPQAFHGLAVEHLMLCLQRGLGTVPGLFEERAKQPPMSVGDWQLELSKKLQQGKPHDISFWKDPAWALLDELGTPRPTFPTDAQ